MSASVTQSPAAQCADAQEPALQHAYTGLESGMPFAGKTEVRSKSHSGTIPRPIMIGIGKRAAKAQEIMRKPAKQSRQRAQQLQKMIESAQRQPGLDEILRLVYQMSNAHQVAAETKAGSAYVGGASVGETPSVAIAIS
jgi:enoyl-CoA hydratase/carnithine racemase